MMDLDDIVLEINNRMRRLVGAPLKPTHQSIISDLHHASQEIERAMEDIDKMRRMVRDAHRIPPDLMK